MPPRLFSGRPRTAPVEQTRWDVPSAPAGGGSGAGDGQQANVPRVQFPPIFVPPAGAINFFAAGNAVTGVGPTAFVAFAGVGTTVQLPPGMAGVIRGYTFGVNGLLLTSQISFAIRSGNNALAGVGNVVMPQAALGAFFYSPDSDGVYIKVPVGGLIQVFVMVTDAVAYQVNFELRGWMYNKVVDDQWRGVI